jgi:hypothetical protein
VPVTDRGELLVFKCQGSHIFEKINSQLAVRLSALRVGRALTPKTFPGTHFSNRLCQPQSYSADGRKQKLSINSMDYDTLF